MTRNANRQRDNNIAKNQDPTQTKVPIPATMNQIEEDKDPNPNLPVRLFAVDCYPDGARLNIYSKPEYLGIIASILKGSKEWEQIKNSQFGKLFEFPVAQCSHSGKLIHGLLSRQLVTKKNHELWFVFGGYPIRFSIREFHLVTGLRCCELPIKKKHEDDDDLEYLSVWNKLFGKKSIVTVVDVLEMLQKDKLITEKEKKFSSWKKLCLALIVIVDGVLVCPDKHCRVSPEFVEMLNDIDFFLEYPWGRKAFIKTIRRFGPPKNASNPIEELKERLKQQSSACYGFPLALQLQALQSIPVILERIKDATNLRNFAERSSEGLLTPSLLCERDILDAEVDDKLVVAHTLEPKGTINESELVWETEVSDPKVDFILKLINEGHSFKPFEWPGGDTSLPKLREPLLKAADQEVNVLGKNGDSPEDLTEVYQERSKKPIQDKVKAKPFTRSSKKEKPTAKVHAGGESNDYGDIMVANLNDMKEWILKQNEDLRKKIKEDIQEIVGSKSHLQEDIAAGEASNLRRSNRLNTNCGAKMAKTDAPLKKTGNTGKRKRVEVQSISNGTVSSGDIEVGEDVQFSGKESREGGEDVQSPWNEDENAPSPGTFDQDGDAQNITREGDLMQEEGDLDHCSNCEKTKESMMREIENLELNLQLYRGLGLNHLTYDDLLRFELELESSLRNARARKFEFMQQQQQQQQTDKLNGKGKEIVLMDEETQHFSHPGQLITCQRQENDDIMYRQVKKEFLFYGVEQPAGVLNLFRLPQPLQRAPSSLPKPGS